MRITSNSKHNKCPVECVILKGRTHYAELRCTRHQKNIQWLTESAVQQLRDLGVPVR